MNGKDLLLGMDFVDEKYIEEAQTILKIRKTFHWQKYLAAAACLVITAAAALLAADILNLPRDKPIQHSLKAKCHSRIAMILDPRENKPLSKRNIFPGNMLPWTDDSLHAGINPENPDIGHTDSTAQSTEQTGSTDQDTHPIDDRPHGYQINMNDIIVNQMAKEREASFAYDPQLHDFLIWNMEDILSYYGQSVIPAYIPEQLEPSPHNTTATILADKSGVPVNDLIYFDFYHAYDEKGSPLLDEDHKAKIGLSIAVSKIGTISDLIYVGKDSPDITCIKDTSVIFGRKDTSYETFTAKFQHKDTHYLIVTEQISLEELVKVVTSIIYESENISINNPSAS